METRRLSFIIQMLSTFILMCGCSVPRSCKNQKKCVKIVEKCSSSSDDFFGQVICENARQGDCREPSSQKKISRSRTVIKSKPRKCKAICLIERNLKCLYRELVAIVAAETKMFSNDLLQELENSNDRAATKIQAEACLLERYIAKGINDQTMSIASALSTISAANAASLNADLSLIFKALASTAATQIASLGAQTDAEIGAYVRSSTGAIADATNYINKLHLEIAALAAKAEKDTLDQEQKAVATEASRLSDSVAHGLSWLNKRIKSVFAASMVSTSKIIGNSVDKLSKCILGKAEALTHRISLIVVYLLGKIVEFYTGVTQYSSFAPLMMLDSTTTTGQRLL